MSSGLATFNERRAPSTGCTTSMIDECEVRECELCGAEVPSVQQSAGPITVEGLRMDAGYVLTFGTEGCFHNCPAYASPPGLVPDFWRGGETLTVSAPGATVPGFVGKTVTAPNPIAVTEPACTGTGFLTPSCTLNRAEPLTVAWTGGASTVVETNLVSTAPGRFVSVTCRFASSPAVVPAAAMARLGGTEAGFGNSLRINGSNHTTFNAGDYDVTLEAANFELLTRVNVTN